MARAATNDTSRAPETVVDKGEPIVMKIDKPGIYTDIPMSRYHADLCAGPSVSASVLTLMSEYESCPAKAWARYYGNAAAPEDDGATPAMQFGTAVHAMVLEGEEEFFRRYVMKPASVKFNTIEGKAWQAAHGGREFIAETDLDTIRAMHKALLANPDTRRCFTGGRAEVTCVVRDADTGLWLKVRPDYLRPGLAINFKTARNSARWMWPTEAWRYGHHVSAALCVDVLAQLGEKVNECFVIQEKVFPYVASVRVLDDAFLEAGRMVYRAALRRFAECLAKNEWPGYPGVETIKLPAYADRLLADAVSE